MEVCVTFPKYKKFVNRGFMLGPYCPIYGYSSIIMILYLNHYKDNPLTVFLLAVVVCSFIEYMVSYVMEKIFKARWWDYSNRKFNINGRVCLNNAFFFGVLGTFLVYYANPFFENILLKINTNTLNTISLIYNTITKNIETLKKICKIKNKKDLSYINLKKIINNDYTPIIFCLETIIKDIDLDCNDDVIEYMILDDPDLCCNYYINAFHRQGITQYSWSSGRSCRWFFECYRAE